MKGWIRLTKYSLFTHQAKPGHRYPRVKSPKRREFDAKARKGHAKFTASWDTGCIKLYRKGGREKFDRIIKQKLHGRKKKKPGEERKSWAGEGKKVKDRANRENVQATHFQGNQHARIAASYGNAD